MNPPNGMPEWLSANWEARVEPLLAVSLAHQVPEERERIHAALDAGALIDYQIDARNTRVIFSVEGLEFCEISFNAIIGIPVGATEH